MPDCPVPAPDHDVLRRLRTTVKPAGTTLRRGHKKAYANPNELVPGLGDTRFAPLPDTSHVYLASTTFAALLESAFHEASPPVPRIYRAQLAQWVESEVALNGDVRLVDLRDSELDRLGLRRDQLVATTPTHYPCTRAWAHALQARVVGGQLTHGLVWHSRQQELHARSLDDRPALQDLVETASAEVAVIWSPPAVDDILTGTGNGLGRLDTGRGADYIDDLSALLGITIP